MIQIKQSSTQHFCALKTKSKKLHLFSDAAFKQMTEGVTIRMTKIGSIVGCEDLHLYLTKVRNPSRLSGDEVFHTITTSFTLIP